MTRCAAYGVSDHREGVVPRLGTGFGRYGAATRLAAVSTPVLRRAVCLPGHETRRGPVRVLLVLRTGPRLMGCVNGPLGV